MSIYSTPLQFAYFFSSLLAIIFAWRGWKREQLNLKLLAFLMLIFALELQDYTFGFSGINFLWNELKGFPRGVHLLFGPAMLFYLRAQVNRNFKLQGSHALHLIPWAVFFFPELVVFFMGPETVERVGASSEYEWGLSLAIACRLLSYAWYFYYSWQLLAKYRNWIGNRFSETDSVSLGWFRNFLILMIAWIVFRELLNIVDAYLDLPFSQDWWWNLALAIAAIYVGISGLSQSQPADMVFEEAQKQEDQSKLSLQPNIMEIIDQRMQLDRYYLQPELSIRELASQLKIPLNDLSQAINQAKNTNFNDYINDWRVREFIEQYPKPENRQYTILSVALDCGFNSKATFNRAFKKVTGASPKAYFERAQSA